MKKSIFIISLLFSLFFSDCNSGFLKSIRDKTKFSVQTLIKMDVVQDAKKTILDNVNQNGTFDTSKSFNFLIDQYRKSVFLSYETDELLRIKSNLNNPQDEASDQVKNLFDSHKHKNGIEAPIYFTHHDLLEKEKKFIKNRSVHVKNCLKNVFFDNQSICTSLNSYVPKIAICASGGGFRAMMATAGLIQGLINVGLMDSVTYMAVLSGSTWAASGWSLGVTPQVLIKTYKKYAKLALNSSTISTLKKDSIVAIGKSINENNMFCESKELEDNIKRKFFFEQPIDLVDYYGSIVAHMTMAFLDDPALNVMIDKRLIQSRQRVFFSQIEDSIELSGYKFPLPIATAVCPILDNVLAKKQKLSSDNNLWFEFSPYYVGFEFFNLQNKKIGAFVDTFAFGRKFKKIHKKNKNKDIEIVRYGSISNDPELPLSYLMGIWGSAFAFSFQDIIRLQGLTNQESEKSSDISQSIISFFMKNKKYQGTRIFPSTINNFSFAISDSPFQNKTLTLVDAGLAFNLPFPPLLRKERNVDVIIVLDASANVIKKDKVGNISIPALDSAKEYADRMSLPFVEIKKDPIYHSANQKACTIFKNGDGPIIIFIPFIDNEFDKDFNVAKAMTGECKTFNFKYSESTIDGATSHVSKTIFGIYPEILESIKFAIERKILQIKSN